MGHRGQVKKFLFSNLLIYLLSCSAVYSAIVKNAKQFPNLSFAVPVIGLLGGNSGGNIFGRNTVTRTVISTVATVTVPSYRTCTTSAAALMPCAGKRKRRDTDAENALDDEINASPSIKIIIGQTEITDQGTVAEILHLNKDDLFNLKKKPDEVVDPTTGLPIAVEGRDDFGNSGTTANYPVYLDPSEEATTAAEVTSQEFSDDAVVSSPDGRDSNSNADNVVEVTTGETPYSDDINKQEDSVTTGSPLDDEEERARLGVGGSGKGGGTVTTTIPVTHVVSTAVTVMGSTLTVMYGGCSPPGQLPVITSLCMP